MKKCRCKVSIPMNPIIFKGDTTLCFNCFLPISQRRINANRKHRIK